MSDGVLFKGNIEEGSYRLIKTTDGWVLVGKDIVFAGSDITDRPQGEWIYCEDEYGIDGYRCSNCGKHIAWDYQHKFINFIEDYHTCPFCDARMKGADDE